MTHYSTVRTGSHVQSPLVYTTEEAALKEAMSYNAETGEPVEVHKNGVEIGLVCNGRYYRRVPSDSVTVESAPRPDTAQGESAAIGDYLVSGLNALCEIIPSEARLPGSPDLLKQVRHAIEKYRELLAIRQQTYAIIPATHGRSTLPEREAITGQITTLYNEGFKLEVAERFAEIELTILVFKRRPQSEPFGIAQAPPVDLPSERAVIETDLGRFVLDRERAIDAFKNLIDSDGHSLKAYRLGWDDAWAGQLLTAGDLAVRDYSVSAYNAGVTDFVRAGYLKRRNAEAEKERRMGEFQIVRDKAMHSYSENAFLCGWYLQGWNDASKGQINRTRRSNHNWIDGFFDCIAAGYFGFREGDNE